MSTQVNIEPSWQACLSKEFDLPYFATLVDFVRKAYQSQRIYPPAKFIFHAFNLCDFDRTRVVILGQDPYHGSGQAHGLSFSVPDGVKKPPSLVNILQEIADDLGESALQGGNLECWARQGVLMLNATLTVQAKQPGSHQNKGWERFTDAVIQVISQNKEHVVFLLWGAYAQKKSALIDRGRHLVLTSAHPSPYSVHRGFFGNRHFSQTNQYLITHGLAPIKW